MDIYAIRKQNLLALMAGKTQRSCADRWETSPSTLSQIVSKKPVRNLGDDLARKIEQAEGLPAGWFDHLHHGENLAGPSRAGQVDGGAKTAEPGNVTPAQQPDRLYRYPVISRVAAGTWQEAIEACDPWAYDTFELADYQAKGPAFWLQVSGDSMTSPVPPSIPEGHLILVDTGIEPRPGDMVVAKLVEADEATFKMLVADAGQLYLKPLNPAYRMIPIDERCRLIGVVVEAKMKLRR